MKNSYFYMIWFPGDYKESLDWFAIRATRREARLLGLEKAKDLGWKFKFLSHGSEENYIDYWGKSTVVVEQRTAYEFAA